MAITATIISAEWFNGDVRVLVEYAGTGKTFREYITPVTRSVDGLNRTISDRLTQLDQLDTYLRAVAPGPVVRQFETVQSTFDTAENPLSESGRWVNGLTLGKDWSNVQASGGIACGTQTGPVAPPYDDSIALCIPPSGLPWTDMQIEAQVVIPSRVGWTGNHEVELLLRGAMAANSMQMYEAIFSVNAGTTYTEIVRWNGSLNGFTSLTGAVNNLSINNGDWIKATIIGTTITLYLGTLRTNYVQKLAYDTVNDATKYASGFPGFGHWRNDGETVALTSYGVTSWYATQI